MCNVDLFSLGLRHISSLIIRDTRRGSTHPSHTVVNFTTCYTRIWAVVHQPLTVLLSTCAGKVLWCWYPAQKRGAQARFGRDPRPYTQSYQGGLRMRRQSEQRTVPVIRSYIRFIPLVHLQSAQSRQTLAFEYLQRRSPGMRGISQGRVRNEAAGSRAGHRH